MKGEYTVENNIFDINTTIWCYHLYRVKGDIVWQPLMGKYIDHSEKLEIITITEK